MKVKKLFFEAVKSRTFVALWIVAAVQSLILLVISVLNTHGGSNIKIQFNIGAATPEIYTGAAWYYTLNFAIFAVVMLALDVFISLKLLEKKGRELALAWLWLNLALFLIITVMVIAFLRAANVGR